MKNLKYLILMAIPVMFLSCNEGTNKNKGNENDQMRNQEQYRNQQEQNRNQQQDQDKTKTEVDTISQGSVFYFRQNNNDEVFV